LELEQFILFYSLLEIVANFFHCYRKLFLFKEKIKKQKKNVFGSRKKSCPKKSVVDIE